MGEQILQAAAETHAVRPPMVIRMGQIAGPLPTTEVAKGSGSTWQRDQAVPSMILSSKAIGALPETLREKNKIRWIPVDTCARIVLDLASVPEATEIIPAARVFNITNLPSAEEELSWSRDIMPLVQRHLEQSHRSNPLAVVTLLDWVGRMIEYGPKADNPAFRLLDFFEDLAGSDEHGGLGGNIDVEKAKDASKTFRELGDVRLDWMEYWMKGWDL
jgi:hypothetical protein